MPNFKFQITHNHIDKPSACLTPLSLSLHTFFLCVKNASLLTKIPSHFRLPTVVRCVYCWLCFIYGKGDCMLSTALKSSCCYAKAQFVLFYVKVGEEAPLLSILLCEIASRLLRTLHSSCALYQMETQLGFDCGSMLTTHSVLNWAHKLQFCRFTFFSITTGIS